MDFYRYCGKTSYNLVNPILPRREWSPFLSLFFFYFLAVIWSFNADQFDLHSHILVIIRHISMPYLFWKYAYEWSQRNSSLLRMRGLCYFLLHLCHWVMPVDVLVCCIKRYNRGVVLNVYYRRVLFNAFPYICTSIAFCCVFFFWLGVHHGYVTGTVAIIRMPKCQLSMSKWYIKKHITNL